MRIRTKAEARRILRRLGRDLPAEEARRLEEQLLGGEARPRNRKVVGEMSPLERRFAFEVLEPMALAGEIERWEYETEVLTLSREMRCSYRPDFPAWPRGGGRAYYEVKGPRSGSDSMFGDGIVKLKWAAHQFHLSRFYLCVPRKGGWSIKLMGGRA
jgi:hypothetical protein